MRNSEASTFSVEPRISPRFDAPDADISFVSSDRVIFRLHRVRLESHAEGFPPSSLGEPNCDELIPLSETSTTLELLFQHIYPRSYPTLDGLAFEELERLAEAAEKYQVYSAMEVCRIHLRHSLKSHPLEVLNYAVRHNYSALADEAAPLSIGMPVSKVMRFLSYEAFSLWVKYQEHWLQTLQQATSLTDTTHFEHGTRKWTLCETDWLNTCAIILRALGGKPENLMADKLNELISQTKPHCGKECCREQLKRWQQEVGERVGGIPRFSKLTLGCDDEGEYVAASAMTGSATTPLVAAVTA